MRQTERRLKGMLGRPHESLVGLALLASVLLFDCRVPR